MKKIIGVTLFVFLATHAFAQKGDAILGKWLSPGGRGQVEVYKKNNKYFGKIVWLKVTADKNGKPLTDRRNLNLSLRKRPVLGLEVLKNCNVKGKYYDDGTIYDPESGKTYTCNLFLNGNKLKVTGFVGMFVGRTDTWTRVN
ncbi:DUF2147 domain-containing protein [Mucilaginibacter sp.]|uniref:DUF2147 domain-containing protein n=1 Tax=Mucilaginibacter sp. TaxID=1882438 RepID=UPI002ED5000E